MADDFSVSSLDFQEILENVATGVYVVTADRRIVYWNGAAEKITGFPENETVGFKCRETGLRHLDETGINLCENECPLVKSVKTGEKIEKRVWVHTKESSIKHILVKTMPFYKNGKVAGAVETFDDISQIDELERVNRELKEMSIRDELTDLYNKRELYEHLGAIVAKAGRGVRSAVLMIDIDKFKRINDRCGHLEGDRILVKLSERLKKNLRIEDMSFRPVSARFGGDEFVVILEMGEKTSKENVMIIAERISKSMNEIETCMGPLKASIGMTIVFENDSVEKLLKRVDEALYSSKISGEPVCAITEKRN